MAPWRVMAAMSGVLATVLWNPAVGPLPFRSPRSQARHGGVKAGFVHEYKAPGVEAASQPPPQAPRFLVALGGYE